MRIPLSFCIQKIPSYILVNKEKFHNNTSRKLRENFFYLSILISNRTCLLILVNSGVSLPIFIISRALNKSVGRTMSLLSLMKTNATRTFGPCLPFSEKTLASSAPNWRILPMEHYVTAWRQKRQMQFKQPFYGDENTFFLCCSLFSFQSHRNQFLNVLSQQNDFFPFFFFFFFFDLSINLLNVHLLSFFTYYMPIRSNTPICIRIILHTHTAFSDESWRLQNHSCITNIPMVTPMLTQKNRSTC